MKIFLINKAYWIYNLIFREEPSDGVKDFINNLWYVIIGFGFYAVCGFIFQVLEGRILGPAQYGQLVLVQSISTFLLIPMSLCTSTALIKYNAEKDDLERQKKIISVAYAIIFVLSLICVSSFFIFLKPLSDVFNISSVIFSFSIIFALFYNLYILSTDTLRSLHKIKELSIIQALYGFCMLIAILPFIFIGIFSFHIALLIEYAAYFFVFFIIIIYIRKYLSFDIDRYWIVKILRYSSFGIWSAIASAFYQNFGKIIINGYLTLSDLGIYGAYYMCFITLPAFLFNIFNTVFFPAVSRSTNKKAIWLKLNKMIFFSVILGLPCVIILGFIFFKLYGSAYHFDIWLGILFSASSMIIFIDGVYGWFMNSIGEKGVKIVSLSAIALAITNIILSLLLIPLIGIYGSVIALAISYIVAIIIFLLNRRILK